ncbi:MAG: hypothetical protein GY780_00705, partial [bacterium]|nr:hypothetical protein [bacterium]
MLEQLRNLAQDQGSNSPEQLDLTNGEHLALATSFADTLLAVNASVEDYQALEGGLVARKDEVPLLVHLASKLALSRRTILQWDQPGHLSVVFAMYKENQR